MQDIEGQLSGEGSLKLSEIETLLNGLIPDIMPNIWKLVNTFQHTFVKRTLSPDIWNRIERRCQVLEENF